MGNCGAALAIDSSYWLNTILLGFILKYSSAIQRTPLSFSKDVFLSIGGFFRFAVPSGIMVCLEWWSCELLAMPSGLFPNAQLEISVLSMWSTSFPVLLVFDFVGISMGLILISIFPSSLTIGSLHFYIPYSFGAAVRSILKRFSYALNYNYVIQAARLTIWGVMILEAAEVAVASTTLFCCRNVLGNVFNDDKEVVDYVTGMVPLVCLSIFIDSFQAVLSVNLQASIQIHSQNLWRLKCCKKPLLGGIARGCGWQHIGAYVNLGAFYFGWNSYSSCVGICFPHGGKRLLDWTNNRALSAVHPSLSDNEFNWQKTGTGVEQRSRGENHEVSEESFEGIWAGSNQDLKEQTVYIYHNRNIWRSPAYPEQQTQARAKATRVQIYAWTENSNSKITSVATVASEAATAEEAAAPPTPNPGSRQ
ncbi:MATE efflux family protein [Actinidia rufa]|uniref:MATE efflux family protein n=1 Tax=Actinidia rufa TaxID=165716 RepID=A0A7J0H7G3_9ERIC|nr:MATE efflux family protein [Actinidia rufa]